MQFNLPPVFHWQTLPEKKALDTAEKWNSEELKKLLKMQQRETGNEKCERRLRSMEYRMKSLVICLTEFPGHYENDVGKAICRDKGGAFQNSWNI